MYKLKRHFGTSQIKQVCKQYALECYRAQKSADLWLSRRSMRGFPDYIAYILVSPGSKK